MEATASVQSPGWPIPFRRRAGEPGGAVPSAGDDTAARYTPDQDGFVEIVFCIEEGRAVAIQGPTMLSDPLAFPIVVGPHIEHKGMTKREMYAAKAMNGILQSEEVILTKLTSTSNCYIPIFNNLQSKEIKCKKLLIPQSKPWIVSL